MRMLQRTRDSPANGEPPGAAAATTSGGDEYFVMADDVRMYAGDGAKLAENGRVVMVNAVSGSADGDAVQVPELVDDAVRDAPNEELDVDGELVAYAGQPRSEENKNAKDGGSWSGSLSNGYAATYHPTTEREGDFSVSDLVWGKVKSHPWWPGQIFHPSDSSEKAMKYYRKDCYLVAYFGDHTFAWNEPSQLKPFRANFFETEKQSNLESFRKAVSCALEEVSRRVEFGLACSCLPAEVCNNIKFQAIGNAGIRDDSSSIEGTDEASGVDSFQPDKLVGYIKALAESPSIAFDRLDVMIAKAQLLAFYRLKGYYSLPHYQFHEGILENDADASLLEDGQLSTGAEHKDSVLIDDSKLIISGKGREASHKRKHNLRDIVYHRRKQKSLSELMGESIFCLDSDYESDEKDSSLYVALSSGKKRKVVADCFDDSVAEKGTRTISLAKVSQTMVASPRQSFKIGECIRRVASQLSGSSSMPKHNDESSKQHAGDDFDESLENVETSLNGSMASLSENSSVDQLLAELLLTARHPLKGYSFLNPINRFFSEFRNSVISTQHHRQEASSMGKGGPGRKRKASLSIIESPRGFEFDDVNDSYWTDMVVENRSEGKLVRRARERKECKPVSSDPEKPLQSRPRSRMHSKRQQNHDNRDSDAEKPATHERKQDQLPTELILNFNEVDAVPSEENLIQMFRHFGPLKESETEVDRQTSRAKVVFKRCSDAEVAYSSAAVFNIFGSAVINYKLNYGPSLPIKNSPLALTQGHEDSAT
ncbi:hypothetical protein Dimus_022062 [Dionaea muscipula]